MSELQADFRRYYHTKYEYVDVDETLALIKHLPSGSAYRSAHFEFGEWTDELNAMADITDSIYMLINLLSSRGTTEGAPRVTRPQMLMAMKLAQLKKQQIRDRIDNTKWVELNG